MGVTILFLNLCNLSKLQTYFQMITKTTSTSTAINNITTGTIAAVDNVSSADSERNQ